MRRSIFREVTKSTFVSTFKYETFNISGSDEVRISVVVILNILTTLSERHRRYGIAWKAVCEG
jgi:hypothetical protein